MAEYLGYVAAFFTVTATLPQLIKTIKTKSAGDVSVLMFIFMFLGTALWAVYGYLVHSSSIVVANTLAATCVATNLSYKIIYNK